MIDIIKPLIKQFLPFAQERMGFEDPPRLFVRHDEQNAQNPLGKTAYYDPSAKSVTLYTTGRHPKDVMRSLSHELVHHTQNCNGEFDNVGEMGEGYAQNDSHLREMERQAYEIGNLCFRDWEDSIKQTIYFEHLQKGVEKVMSTKDWKNGELKSLLSEAWGFKMDLSKLNETGGPSDPADYTGTRNKEDDEKEDLKDEGALQEMGCGDHAPEDEVVVMQSGDEEGPDDPNAIVDELGDLVARLSAALGGAMGAGESDEMVVDMGEGLGSYLKGKLGGKKEGGAEQSEEEGGEEQETEKEGEEVQERLRRAIRKALKETGAGRTGASKGDKGKDEDDPEARDYEDGGDRKDDESKTHPGTDYSGHHPHHKTSHGHKDDDSTEKEHYRDNAMSDDEHIKAIEHHLDALRKDRDYDEEKEGDLEERRGRGRKGPHIRGAADPRLREAVLKALKKSIVKKTK